MLSFNPANAQWPSQMLPSCMHCLLHVPISLVTKVFELRNWNGEVFSCRKSKVGQVALGLTDPGSLSSQLQLKFCFVRNHIRNIWENARYRACTVFEGDSKHPVPTDSRAITVPTSQIQDLLYPSSPWSQQLPGFRCKLSTFQLLEVVARVVNSGDNSGK